MWDFLFTSKIDEGTSKADQKKTTSKKPVPVTTSKYKNRSQLGL